jgi:putative membrane-bound dehydrogenase-like protein
MLLLLCVGPLYGAEPAATGPAAENRFPPLQLPTGFKATLYACDPMIEYPSVIAAGPRAGSLYVAIDYMTGLGIGLERRDEIRLLEDTDGDGYADKSTVFATGFNSIQGLAYHRGTVYVMHAPFLTALRDTKGTGKADERRELLAGLGLAPEKDQIRLHNANGVVAGHDAWLYLALGDHGCDVKRPEGDRLVLNGGGILRCRPDGRDLHIFATGLRNIYDVALDEDLNVFVRDNENDGGDYKIRVCHSFFGADHGYPYLYFERPHEALAPLADLGLGSSAGGVCYLERQFPPEYRGNLFFCEWGRAVVRYPLKRSGASFATPKEIDFAAGDPKDPYGFKPTDLVVDRDGSLFVSDWADGQRPKRGRGRIYRISFTGRKDEETRGQGDKEKDPIKGLDSESYFERCEAQEAIERRGKDGLTLVDAALEKNQLGVRGRLHAIWIVARLDGPAAVERLLGLAKSDPDPRVQAQAIRALADLTDPVLVRHRLQAGGGELLFARRVADIAVGRDPRVMLEAIIVMGRLHWFNAPEWLQKNVRQPDSALSHAAQWTLRQPGIWLSVKKLLGEPNAEPLRVIALRAVSGQYDSGLVDELIFRLQATTEPSRRREYADALTRVWKKPATPWVYWGFRPPARPASSVAWERTEAIEKALNDALDYADASVRTDLLRFMLREKISAPTATLAKLLDAERKPEIATTLLNMLADRPGRERGSLLQTVIRDQKQSVPNRLLAVSLFLRDLDAKSEESILDVALRVEDGPVLAELLRAAGKRKLKQSSLILLRNLKSTDAEVRAAAVGAIGELELREAQDPIRALLKDPEARVRSAAAEAAGKSAIRAAADQLIKLVRDPDAGVRRSSLEALHRLREPRARPAAVAALADPDAAVAALKYLADLGGPEHAEALTHLVKRQPSVDVLAGAARALSNWRDRDKTTDDEWRQLDRAIANIHGNGGSLLVWQVAGPMSLDTAAEQTQKIGNGRMLPVTARSAGDWRSLLATGSDARAAPGTSTKTAGTWLACCEISASGPVEFFTSGSGIATIYVDGRPLYQRDKPGDPGASPDRFDGTLGKFGSRVLVKLTVSDGPAEFQLRFRRKSAAADHERLTQSALTRTGNAERGRQIFLNAEKSQCIKCHRLGEQGERVGPELTGLGSRFSKVYIIESILEPSRTISPSFETMVVLLKNGKSISGVNVAETEAAITLVDNQAAKHAIAKMDIEERRKETVSTMPEGLEKKLTDDEFVDLIAFLASLKDTRGR